MRRAAIASLILSSALTAAASVENPLAVTVCDLVKNPAAYNHKLVEVTAPIELAFEDFSLGQPGCEDIYPGVWLMYGGDEPTPTASTWNDTERKKGKVVRVDRIAIPLQRDAAMDRLQNKLKATRLGNVGDQPCYDCYLYRVTATLSGVFFAARNTANSFSGYGHLGCCNLLAIEGARNVVATRTKVPVGGSFKCATEEKQLTAEEASRLKSFDEPCGTRSYAECQMLDYKPMAAVAAMWGDGLKREEGFPDGSEISGDTRTTGWRTLDRLRYYELLITAGSDAASGGSFSGRARRTVCTAVVEPLSASAEVNCRSFKKEFQPVEALERRIGQAKDLHEVKVKSPSLEPVARDALPKALKAVGIAVEPGGEPVDCEMQLGWGSEESARCFWLNRTSTVSLSLYLIRSGVLGDGDPKGAGPWVLVSASADVCEVER
ncbi:MAG: hypothetical protein ABSG60_08930 [Terracidiphilus sp.]|jgi:hypothetical protein